METICTDLRATGASGGSPASLSSRRSTRVTTDQRSSSFQIGPNENFRSLARASLLYNVARRVLEHVSSSEKVSEEERRLFLVYACGCLPSFHTVGRQNALYGLPG